MTVTCSFQRYGEGQDPVNQSQSVPKRIYRIEAVACNGTGTTCPEENANVARADYVERARVATACTVEPNGFCY